LIKVLAKFSVDASKDVLVVLEEGADVFAAVADSLTLMGSGLICVRKNLKCRLVSTICSISGLHRQVLRGQVTIQGIETYLRYINSSFLLPRIEFASAWKRPAYYLPPVNP
jgi:hypothetical protein